MSEERIHVVPYFSRDKQPSPEQIHYMNIATVFQTDAGWMGFWLTFGGCASGLILARYFMDKSKISCGFKLRIKQERLKFERAYIIHVNVSFKTVCGRY